jgi:predicted TIM-barrel fold metal-dependent hydrolase
MSGYIDVHHHIFTKEYADSFSKNGINTDFGLPYWNADQALEIMDQNNISAAILSAYDPGVFCKAKSPGMRSADDLSHRMNEELARLISKHQGRFGAFATPPLPDVDASLKELEYALGELKLDGVMLLSNYDGYYLGDPKFDALFSALNQKYAVVFVHPTAPPTLAEAHTGIADTLLEADFDITRTVFSLLVNGVVKRYPNIRFILGNAGGATPYMAARVGITSTLTANLGGAMAGIADAMNSIYSLVPKWKEKMPGTLSYYIRFKDNVLPEGPDYYLKEFYYDTAFAASPHTFASLQTVVDNSRIIFGTDCSLKAPEIVPMTIRGIKEYPGFSENDWETIGRANAVRLFPRFDR